MLTMHEEATQTSLNAAIERGIQFLLAARGADGLWHDFWTPAGTSDHWVSGYVGATLAAADAAAAQAAAHETWQLLECNRFAEGGWGYHEGTSLDGDSTGWVLHLAGRLGLQDEERAQQAYEVLRAHRVAGGITTYRQPGPIRAFVRLPDDFDFSGWTSAHTCVTAAVAGLPALRAALLPDLLAAQAPDGSWPSYWWFTPAYATAMAVQALAAGANTPEVQAALHRAGTWAAHQLDPEAKAFEMALLARVLVLAAPGSPEATQAVAHLLASQTAKGSWRGSARLRVPRPDEHNPDQQDGWARWFGTRDKFQTTEDLLQHTFTIFSLDQASIFTTATALETLLQVQQRPAARPAHPWQVTSPPVAPAQVAAFQEQGHILIPDALDPAQVAQFRPQLVAAVYDIDAQTSKADRAALDQQAFVRSEGVWHFDAAVRAFLLQPRLGAIAAALLGVDRARLFHDQAFFKVSGGGPTPWHQDSYYWPLATDQILTLWIPLTAVSPQMGSLRFVSGSHRLGNLGNLDRFNHDPAALPAFAGAHQLTITDPPDVPLGGISAHLGWTVHGAPPNASGQPREVITIVYYADGTHLHNPPAADESPFEQQAARIREKDIARWFAGLRVGDRAVSKETPLVFAANHQAGETIRDR